MVHSAENRFRDDAMTITNLMACAYRKFRTDCSDAGYCRSPIGFLPMLSLLLSLLQTMRVSMP